MTVIYKLGAILLIVETAILFYINILFSKGILSHATVRLIAYAGIFLMIVFWGMMILGSKGETRQRTIGLLVAIILIKLIRMAVGL